MASYCELQRGEHKKAQRYLLEAFKTGRGVIATVTAWMAVSVHAAMQVDSGKFERAVEFITFISRYPLISKSQTLKDIVGPTESVARANLSEGMIVEAQTRGQARNISDTIAEITIELETTLEEGMN
jgi:hypothetical protein